MYVLATTENVLRFYVFKGPGEAPDTLERLDTIKVSRFSNKEAAKQAAMEAGLKTWTYVRIY